MSKVLTDGRIATEVTVIEELPPGTNQLGSFYIDPGEEHIGQVGGSVQTLSVEIANTTSGSATAYAANDVVGAGASAVVTVPNAVRIEGGTGYVVGCGVITDKASITPRLRVHLLNASDATQNGDNDQYKELYANAGKCLRWFDLPAMTTAAGSGSDCSRSFVADVRIPVKAAAGTRSLFAVLETLDAFTPKDGQKYTLKLTIDQD